MSTLKAARESAGLTQLQLADLAGTSQPQIRRLEAGERKVTREWAERLAPHLGISPEALVFGHDAGTSPVTEGSRPAPSFFGPRDLKVFAATEGGPGELVITTDPIDIVARPWYLEHVPDGYAVLVTGESMFPAFRPGDLAIINPRLPPMRGEDHIFVAGEMRGEFRATIKHLTRTTASDWHVRQFNPPEGMEEFFLLSRRLWGKALRVVGSYRR